MFILYQFCLLFLTFSLEGTYLTPTKSPEIYQHLMLHDEPRNFYSDQSLNDDELIWVPSFLWQCGALHLFFIDPQVNKAVKEIGYTLNLYHPNDYDFFLKHPRKRTWPSNFDEEIVNALQQNLHLNDLLNIFDRWMHYEGLSDLFFAINDHTLSLFLKHEKNYQRTLSAILDDLPYHLFHQIPFYQRGKVDIECLAKALQSRKLMLSLLEYEIETKKPVYYRGYHTEKGTLPNPTNLASGQSHALSFGTTLLGGLFFSTDACALRYAFDDDLTANHFFALPVNKQHVVGEKSLFRIGPLHPFLQLLCDGEFFHAHTKVAAKSPADFTEKPLPGYFAKCNRYLLDNLGYVLTFKYNTEELAETINTLFQNEGRLFVANE